MLFCISLHFLLTSICLSGQYVTVKYCVCTLQNYKKYHQHTMFKIESYITPLLMGYIDKYVKLKKEDFQVRNVENSIRVLFAIINRNKLIKKVW